MPDLCMRIRGWANRRPVQARGVVLLLVMIAVASTAILAMTFLNSQSTSLGIAQNVDNHAQARYIAESALSATLIEVGRTKTWRTDFSNGEWVADEPLYGGTFTLYGEDGEDTDGDGDIDGDGDLANSDRDFATITSIGRYGGVTHQVRSLVYPPKNLLMIVADAESLTAAEIARRDLILSWGWGITLLSENADADEFDEAIADAHVIYFPDSPNLTGAVKTGLVDKEFDVPIVTGHQDLVKELRIASNSSKSYLNSSISIKELTQTTTDEFDVETTVVITHYITEPFPIGSLTITSVADQLLRLDGSVAAGVDTLAVKVDETSRVALAAFDNGSLATDKKAFRARRVVLPWGKRGTFLFSHLNDNGKLILRRSLDWAGSSWTGFLPGIAVWDKVEIMDDAVVDGYDSTVGAYGDANVNQSATISTNSLANNKIRIQGELHGHAYVGPDADISKVIKIDPGGVLTGNKSKLNIYPPSPNPKVPEDMPSSSGDVTISNYTIIDSDKQYDKLTLSGTAKVYIVGNTRILCNDDVLIKDNAKLMIAGTNFGTNSIGSQVDEFSVADQQTASMAEIPENGTVTSIRAYVKGTPGTLLRYAVYKDASGQPGQFLVQSATSDVGSAAFHWHEIDIPDTNLNKGTYWLAISHQAGITLGREQAGMGQSRRKNHNAVASGFIDPWGVSDGTDTQNTYIGAAYTPGSGEPSVLTLYTNEPCTLQNNVRMNLNTNDPTRLNWLILKKKVEVTDKARLCAALQGFDGELSIKKDAQVYGTFLGKKARLEDDAFMHVDTGTSGTEVTIGEGTDLQKISTKEHRWVER